LKDRKTARRSKRKMTTPQIFVLRNQINRPKKEPGNQREKKIRGEYGETHRRRGGGKQHGRCISPTWLREARGGIPEETRCAGIPYKRDKGRIGKGKKKGKGSAMHPKSAIEKDTDQKDQIWAKAGFNE